MNRLQLATLLSWAGDQGIKGRKRLQKVVYLLQQAGCNLDCQFTLHYFGPYSRDVADACDEMVAAGLVDECVVQESSFKQYGYALKPRTRDLLSQVADSRMQPFRSLATALVNEQIWQLELGSTILYFFGQNKDWDNAFSQACQFKKVDTTAQPSQRALELAQRVASQSVN